MLAAALVDYDNVCRTVVPERGPTDVAVNLDELVRALSAQAAVMLRGLEELQVRLYGGWIDRSGHLTDRANWLLSQLSGFRRRINRVRIRPVLVRALAISPENDLVATYRPDLTPSQKMVDAMMTVDSLFFVSREQYPILIVSDDDDFVPACIALRLQVQRTLPVVLIRRRKIVGSAPNDALLASLRLPMAIC